LTTRLLVTFILCGSIAASAVTTPAEEPHPLQHDVILSPALRNLLRAEMHEIVAGVRQVPLALATADWKTIEETGKKICESYVFEKKLTPAEEKELADALPEHFRRLDAEFHQRAAKLAAAASAHDPELVAFHYGRLVEGCALCHSEYAGSRFPGFAFPVPQHHHH
jgi:cytochrome c556